MRKLISFFPMVAWLVIIPIAVQAQNDPSTWKLIGEKNDVRVLYKIGNCNGADQLWLMIENASGVNYKVEAQLTISQDALPKTLPTTFFEVKAHDRIVLDCERRVPHLTHLQIMVKTASLFECTLSSFNVVAQP